jgi:DNA-binding NtrC family response regulator
MNEQHTVLMIDDNPAHLEIYRLIVESAGFRGLPALVTSRGVDFPDKEAIDAVLLDYRLALNISAADVAQRVKGRFPGAPIVLLSDMYDAPADIAPLIRAFVRKGNPEKLLHTLHDVIRGSAAGN